MEVFPASGYFSCPLECEDGKARVQLRQRLFVGLIDQLEVDGDGFNDIRALPTSYISIIHSRERTSLQTVGRLLFPSPLFLQGREIYRNHDVSPLRR